MNEPIRVMQILSRLNVGGPALLTHVLASGLDPDRCDQRVVPGTVGSAVRDELLEARIGRPSQYVVLPPGVQSRSVGSQAAARERLGIPPDVPVVAYVARLTRVKRPDRFVRVALRVAEQRPEAR